MAPLNGEIIPLEKVPDPVFSEKMMGEGIAILPSDGHVLSPVEGEIIQVAPTKHAVGILDKNGLEILIHIGLETVALKGEGFTVTVSPGDNVVVGQPLISFDLHYIQENAKSIMTPIIITNSHTLKKQYQFTEETEAKATETIIMTVTENGA